MLDEFSYGDKTYEIKSFLDQDYSDDQVVEFENITEIRKMFKSVIERNNAWAEVMGIVLFNNPYTCRPPKNCPEPTDEELLEQLCLQIFNGDLILIEKKIDCLHPGDIKDLRLDKCCVETIKEINPTTIVSVL